MNKNIKIKMRARKRKTKKLNKMKKNEITYFPFEIYMIN